MSIVRKESWPQYTLLVGGGVGFIASFVLTLEKIALLKDPSHIPSCNLNPILSCASAMSTPQAEVFGIPNSLFGSMAYTALLTLSALILFGAKIPQRIWKLAVLIAFAGVLYMHYLLITSIFFIHAICPWCFSIWITTLPVFLATCTLYSKAAGQSTDSLSRITRIIDEKTGTIAGVWYVLLAMTILITFWEYWSSFIL